MYSSLQDAIRVNFESENEGPWLHSWHHLHTHPGDASFPTVKYGIYEIFMV